MIILKLKDGTEEWVDTLKKEYIDNILHYIWTMKTKDGKKTITGDYSAMLVIGIKDVGEKIIKDEE